MIKIIIFTILTIKLFAINNLQYEQSPYLLQHKNNPVNWNAYTKQIIKKAKEQNKLIFLSIGYSTCHWCHVMEDESFSRNDLANVLNKDYISIKIDREEMPSLDSYYQHIFQVMNNRSGGWPLTVILTPNNKVFYSATYLNKDNLISVLNNSVELYKKEKRKIDLYANNIENYSKQNNITSSKIKNIELSETTKLFVNNSYKDFDKENGGFYTQPKFPMASRLNSLLQTYKITKNKKALKILESTLDSMANGGIYDQIEGGFYRYSTDKYWHIPHFEKMLYTQAELLNIYTRMYEITANKKYKKIAIEIINFVNNKFKKDALFYSASDADSYINNKEKEEGFYYTFEQKDVINILENNSYSKGEISNILNYFNITFEGNFENSLSNPYINNNYTIKDINKVKKLFKSLRDKKTYPFIDKKILTSWNAMYINSLLQSSSINDIYKSQAIKSLDKLLLNIYNMDILYHQKLYNKPLKIKANFEDYSYIINLLINAYEHSLDKHYLTLATKLNNDAINMFYKNNIWYLNNTGFNVIAKPDDNACTSPLVIMIDNLFKLSLLNENLRLNKIAVSTLKSYYSDIKSTPQTVSSLYNIFLKYKKQYRVLKSTKENLIKNKLKINILNKNYTLIKATKNKLYLGCSINSCFSFSKDINQVINDMENY